MISEINNSGGFGTQMSDQPLNDTMKQKLQSQGVPENVISQGREEIKVWMKENGKEPSEMEGSTKQASQGMTEEEFKQKAQSMGVPNDVIQQGMQATKAWIMENKENDQNSNSESLFNISV
jgi:pimeloyl-CoA synthetase